MTQSQRHLRSVVDLYFSENGEKGKPDHQQKVKDLEQKAKQDHPNDDVVTEKKIKAEGSNRRPDVQVVDKETG